MANKWRLWCDVHGWVYQWNDNPLTSCPIESSDPVDINKLFIVDEEYLSIEIIPNIYRVSSNYYSRIATIIYDTNSRGPLHRLKTLSYMDNSCSSYSIEVYDKTNETSLVETTFMNTGDYKEQKSTIINNPPEGKVILEINLKRSSNSFEKNYAYVSNISICSKEKGD